MTHWAQLWVITLLESLVAAVVAYWLAAFITASAVETGPVSSLLFFR